MTLVAAVLCWLSTSAAAQAPGPRRVVLERADATLLAAARVALEPWGVRVVADQRPEAGDAVVSLNDEGEGTRLEVRLPDERVQLERLLPVRRPLDEPSAAAVALSLKTLLRNTPLAPEAERLPTPPPAPPSWRLGATVGTRAFALDPVTVEARFDAHFTAFPRLGDGSRPLGIGVDVAGGVPVAVSDLGLDARFHTVDSTVRLEGRWYALDRLVVAGTVGVGGRLGVLAGTVAQPGGGRVSVVRFDLLARAALELVWRLSPRFELGLRVGTSVPLRRQDYRVRGETVLSEAPASLDTGLTFAFVD